MKKVLEEIEVDGTGDLRKILDELFKKRTSLCLEKNVNPDHYEWIVKFEEDGEGNVTAKMIGKPHE